jgi:hypothetical protein
MSASTEEGGQDDDSVGFPGDGLGSRTNLMQTLVCARNRMKKVISHKCAGDNRWFSSGQSQEAQENCCGSVRGVGVRSYQGIEVNHYGFEV